MNTYPFTGMNHYYNPQNQITTTNPIMPTLPTYTTSLHQEIPKVNGKDGALAYPLGPDSSVLALDLNNPILWVIVADSAGYKTATPFDIAEHKDEPPITTADLDSKLETLTSEMNRLKERMNAYEQSGSKSSWHGKPANGNNTQPVSRNDQSGQ